MSSKIKVVILYTTDMQSTFTVTKWSKGSPYGHKTGWYQLRLVIKAVPSKENFVVHDSYLRSGKSWGQNNKILRDRCCELRAGWPKKAFCSPHNVLAS